MSHSIPVNPNAYENVSRRDQIRVDAVILDEFRENPAFAERFRQSHQRHRKDYPNGVGSAQAVLNNVRDVLASGMRDWPSLRDNPTFTDAQDWSRQKNALRDIVNEMGSSRGDHKDISYYAGLAAQNVGMSGLPKGPMPSLNGNVTIHVDKLFHFVDSMDAAKRVSSNNIRLNDGEAMAQTVQDHRQPQSPESGRA